MIRESKVLFLNGWLKVDNLLYISLLIYKNGVRTNDFKKTDIAIAFHKTK